MTPGPFLGEKNVKKNFYSINTESNKFYTVNKILISYFALKEGKGPERDFLIVYISWFDLHECNFFDFS